MPYTWKTGTTTLTERLESFWLYIDFAIGQNRRVKVQDGYLAIYVSQQSGPPRATKPAGTNRDITLQDEADNKIVLKHADLILSRLVEYGNEFNHLHLYKFDDGQSKATWVTATAQDWKPAFKNPTTNDDRKPFWNHTLDFGTVKTRYVYSMIATENATGTQSLASIMPFLSPSALATVLSNDKKVMPPLAITVQKRPAWNYFPKDAKTFAGDVTGFVMVAQGAFKAIDLGAELASWHVPPSKTSTEQIFDRLTGLVHRFPRLRRTLDSASSTLDNSIVPVMPAVPVEVMYLNNLNTRNEVPALIV